MVVVAIVILIITFVVPFAFVFAEDIFGWVKDVLDAWLEHRLEMKRVELDILREKNMAPRDMLLKDYHTDKHTGSVDVYEGYQEIE